MSGSHRSFTHPVPTCMALVIFLFTCAVSASAQQYTRVDVDGWGPAIDLATPFIIDIDGDGRLDLLVGSRTGLAWRYEQDSPSALQFTRVDANFLNQASEYESAITGADIDGDGRIDLLVGGNDGTLYHYEQTETNSEDFTLVSKTFSGIDVGNHSIPCFTDFEKDGLLELVVTESSSPVHVFHQKAAGSYEFEPGKADVFPLRTSYPSPCIVDINNDGLLDALFPNGNDGAIRHFVQNAAVKDSFTLVTEQFSGIRGYAGGVACIHDLNGDGRKEMLLGDGLGRIVMFSQRAADSFDFGAPVDTNVLGVRDFGSQMCIGAADLDANGLLDILVAALVDDINSRSAFFRLEQQTPGGTAFVEKPLSVTGIPEKGWPGFGLVDLDGNGRLDMIFSGAGGPLHRFEQRAGNAEAFDLVSPVFSGGIDPPYNAAYPAFTDLDGNGRLDMVLSLANSPTYVYEQNAPRDTMFTQVADKLPEVWHTFYPFQSFRRDAASGRLLMARTYSDKIVVYLQDSTRPRWFNGIGEVPGIVIPGYPQPVWADVNGDGASDLIVGQQYGGISLYLASGPAAIGQFPGPARLEIGSVYPQPARAGSWIDFSTASASPVTVSLYDLFGRRVFIRTEDIGSAGRHVSWFEFGKSCAPGVYMLHIHDGHSTASVRVFVD